MNLSSCKNAIIYKNVNDSEPLCEVSVSEVVNNVATLIIPDDFIDDLNSEMNITFLDANSGLVIYKCYLSAPKRYLAAKGEEWLNSVECQLVEVVSSLQRREDFKINVDLSVAIIIPAETEIPEDFTDYTSEYGNNILKGKSLNISAGGIYFTCGFKFKPETEIHIYITLSGNQKIKIPVFILRVDEIENKNGTKSYGYGCKYSKISSGVESTIRNFVFQKQRENRKY